MNKETFFEELEESLAGEVSRAEYQDSIAYYRDYFREQEASGKSEQEILEELGSPRLIAHSIIDAHGLPNGDLRGGYYEEEDGSPVHRDSYDQSYQDESGGYSNYDSGYGRYQRAERDTRKEVVNDPEPDKFSLVLSKVGRTMILIAVLLGIGIVLHFMMPVILVIIAVIIIINLFRGF